MKKIIGVIFLFFVTMSIFSLPLTGFWGMPWGITQKNALEQMELKGYSPVYSKDSGYLFKDVKFAGRDGELLLSFKDDQLYIAVYRIKTEKNKVYETYQKIKQDLANKYGVADRDREEYKFPYEKGDGHTETAISLDLVDLTCIWDFDNSDGIMISLAENEFDSSLKNVMLVYFYGKVVLELESQSKKEISDDL